MNVGSLFSGIGGLDLGLARAGFRHAFFCESDPWRRTVLAHHFPGVPIYEDVHQVDETAWSSGWGEGRRALGGESGDTTADSAWAGLGGPGACDLLCGGFPCQDVSVAGRRAGLAGARSGLFHEFARIAESLRPRWILVENVPGLLSSNGGRDFGAVIGTLADIGYGLAWRILDSRYFGVPQRRRRVFILGALADGNPRGAAERAGEILAVGTRCERHPAAGIQAREVVANPLGSGPRSGREQGGMRYDLDNDTYVRFFTTQPDDGVGGRGAIKASEISTSPALDTTADARKSERGVRVIDQTAVRRLTPTECERLQALPDGYTDFGPDSRRYAALGDAVTASVSEWIGRRLVAA